MRVRMKIPREMVCPRVDVSTPMYIVLMFRLIDFGFDEPEPDLGFSQKELVQRKNK